MAESECEAFLLEGSEFIRVIESGNRQVVPGRLEVLADG